MGEPSLREHRELSARERWYLKETWSVSRATLASQATKRDAQMAAEKANSSNRDVSVNALRQAAWWLVVRDDPVEALTLRSGGERVLPIFSFREEAELFAHIEAGEDWLVWEMKTEEVLQMLCNSSTLIERVCLDPLPSVVGSEILELVSLSRERFKNLLATGRFSVSDPPVEGT